MNIKNTIKALLGLLAIFAVLFSIVPSQAGTSKSQFTFIVPDGTDLYVDNVFVGHSISAYYMVYVTYGTHTIKVTKPGYYDWETTVNVNSDISSVTVDRMYTPGNPPPSSDPTPIPYYAPVPTSVPTPIPVYTPSQAPIPYYAPEPISTPASGNSVYMLINAFSGTNVYVDNVDSGTIPEGGSIKISISIGTHSLKLTKQGYQDHVESINANSYLMYNDITLIPTGG